MRKCDICHATIPLGTNKCPNCGAIYKKEKVANGQSQFQLHEDMSFKRTNLNDHMRQFVQHPFDTQKKTSTTPNLKLRNFKRRMMIIITIVFVGLIIEGAGMFVQTSSSQPKESLIGTIVEEIKGYFTKNKEEHFENYNQLYDAYPSLALSFNEVYTYFTNYQPGFAYRDASSMLFNVEKNKIVESLISHVIEVDEKMINSIILADMYNSPNCTHIISYVTDGFITSSDNGLIYIFNTIDTNHHFDYNRFYEAIEIAYQTRDLTTFEEMAITYLPCSNNGVNGYELLITRTANIKK